jgi:hypothetical protein
VAECETCGGTGIDPSFNRHGIDQRYTTGGHDEDPPCLTCGGSGEGPGEEVPILTPGTGDFLLQSVQAGPRVVTLVDEVGPDVPVYLEDFDPEWSDGAGSATWTDDPARAMRFVSVEAAMQTWLTQSKTKPYREDGKPNRPLTGHTITVVSAKGVLPP